MTKYCRVCNRKLTVGENWSKSCVKKCDYICNTCKYVASKNNAKKHAGETHYCIKCNAILVGGENWGIWSETVGKYVCKKCESKRVNEYNHTHGNNLPMSHNTSCSSFLGVHIAEGLLNNFFKNEVERMPYGNSGYDFICGKGYKVDVKSSCIRQQRQNGRKNTHVCWGFGIRKNTIAEYFICIAFDNREDLNVLHAWMIPGEDVNNKTGISISPNTINKWIHYEIDSTSISDCCNALNSFKDNI